MRAAALPFLALPLICVAAALALAGWRSAAPAAVPAADAAPADYHPRFVAPVNGWLPGGGSDPRPAFDVHDCPKLSEIYNLGVAKDAIPALQAARFIPASEADWLDDRAPVLGLKLGGQSRCYPLAILNWHCLVHDTLGGQGLYVFFDPPSGLAVARRMLSRSRPMALAGYGARGVGLTYEIATGRLYDMLSGRYLSGVLPPAGFGRGDTAWLPLERMTWRQWRALHPVTLVLSRDTGSGLDYSFDPYSAAALGPNGSTEDYWTSDTVLAPDSVRDQQQLLPDKAFVLGFLHHNEAWAVPLDALGAAKTVKIVTRAGAEVTIHAQPSSDHYFAVDESGHQPPQVRLFWYAWKAHFPHTRLYVKVDAALADE